MTGYDVLQDFPRIVEAVQKAPSIFNTRPWWIEPRPPDHIELWLRGDPRQRFPQRVAQARAREFVISCGAALFNLRLAIRMTGHDLVVWLLPDSEQADPMDPPALLASVEIVVGRVKRASIAEQELYEAIERRHTNRQPYRILPVPLPILATMEHAAAEEGADLRLLHPREARRWMREAARVDHDKAFEPPFRNVVDRDNYGPPPKNHYPRTRKDFQVADGEKKPFEHKPQLMALSTRDDKPVDWLRAGQALQRAILTGTRYSASAPHGQAAAYHAPRRYGVPARRHLVKQDQKVPQPHGLSASFLTQPLEWDDLLGKEPQRRWPWRWRYADLPQMIMRVGYAAVQSKGQLPPKTHMGDEWSQPPWQPPQGALSSPDSPQP